MKYLTVGPGNSPYNARLENRVPDKQLNTLVEVNSLLADVLSLDGRSTLFTLETPLLGALPELDSMAVIALITGMEERFGFIAEDDEIEGATFATVGSLVAFIDGKLNSLGRCRKTLRVPH